MTILSRLLDVMLFVLALATVALFVVLRLESGTWRPESESKPLALAATQGHAEVAGRRPAAILSGEIYPPGETRPAQVTGRDGSDA